MKTLLKYELFKVISDKFFIISFISLLLLNILSCSFSVTNTSSADLQNSLIQLFQDYNNDPDSIYAKIREHSDFEETQRNLLTDALLAGNTDFEILSLPNQYAPDGYSDQDLFDILLSYVNYSGNYSNTIKSIITQAALKKDEFSRNTSFEDSFSYNYQNKIISKYADLPSKIDFPVDLVRGWDIYFEYEYTNLFIFFSLLISVVILYTTDSTKGLSSLIRTTRYGRRMNALVKLLTAVIFCIFIVVLFYSSILAYIGLSLGFSTCDAPLQLLPNFSLCPYLISVGDYLSILVFSRILSFIVLTVFLSVICAFAQRPVLSFVYALCFGGIQFFLNTNTYINQDNILKNCNFIATTSVHSFFQRYRAINIWGNVIDYLLFIVIFYTFIVLVFSYVLIEKYKNSLPFASNRNTHFPFSLLSTISKVSEKKSHYQEHCLSCISYEYYKILLSKKSIIIIVLLIIKFFSSYYTASPPFTYSDQLYKEYLLTLEGTLTDDSRVFISCEREHIDSILNKQFDMQQKFSHGEIAYNEYRSYLSEYHSAYTQNDVLRSIENKEKYIDILASKGYDSWFIYETGWNSVFFSEFDWTLYFVLILLSSGVFSPEFSATSSSHGFINILRSTKHGRKLIFTKKMISIGSLSALFTLLWIAINICFVSFNHELHSLSAPIHSITRFANFIPHISIGTYFLLFLFFKIGASLLMCFLLCSLSIIFKNTLISVIIITTATLTPSILSFFKITLFSSIDFTAFFRVSPMLLLNYSAIPFIMGIVLLCVLLTSYARKVWID